MNIMEKKTTHLRIVPHLDTSPNSLVFDVIERDLHDDTVLKIGRFTDRFHNLDRITFRSKVVSRGHAEIFIENDQVKKKNYTHAHTQELTPFFFSFVVLYT